MEALGRYSFNPEYLFYRLYELLTGRLSFVWAADFWFWLKFFSVFVALVFLAGVIIVSRRLIRLRRAERAEFATLLDAVAARTGPAAIDPDWQRVLDHLASTNPAEWRLAIIEADKLLETLVKAMNYPGESLGERLKQIEPSDFRSLNQAWEAHKTRNRIAHEGGYELSEREARETIARYRAVFDEFGYL